MAFFHHNTIRSYVAVLISIFNDLEVQHKKSTEEVVTKKIPLKYSSREKSKLFDEVNIKQYNEGNYNFLPRSNISFVAITKSEQRQTNKNNKINLVKSTDNIEFSLNSVSYDFTFELVVQCRGMNEASQIIEQVLPKFDPTINIDIFDGTNLSEATRIPIKLLDVGFELSDYDELSSNIINITFSLSILGNLYGPIKNSKRIKEFIIRTNEIEDKYYVQKVIQGWDVDSDGFLSTEILP